MQPTDDHFDLLIEALQLIRMLEDESTSQQDRSAFDAGFERLAAIHDELLALGVPRIEINRTYQRSIRSERQAFDVQLLLTLRP